MNTENSSTNQPHKYVPSFTQRLHLKNSDKYVALKNISINYTWENIRQQYKSNKLKIIAPTWNDEFEFPDGSYSVSDIQVDVEYIIKKHEILTDNAPVDVYINKINKRLIFQICSNYEVTW